MRLCRLQRQRKPRNAYITMSDAQKLPDAYAVRGTVKTHISTLHRGYAVTGSQINTWVMEDTYVVLK